MIPCQLCDEDDPFIRCYGVCQNVRVRYCIDWIFLGCGDDFFTVPSEAALTAEEHLERSVL